MLKFTMNNQIQLQQLYEMGERIMKKQMKMMLTLMLVFIISLTGCKKDSGLNISIGSFDGNVYENTWINMKFQIPESFTILSDDELAGLLSIDSDKMNKLRGSNKEVEKASDDLKTIYGFIASSTEGLMRVQLIFDNLLVSKDDTNSTEKEYLEKVKKSLLELDAGKYEVVEETTKEIAGKTFEVLKMTGNDGAVNQEYYCYKKDDCMMNLLLIYSSDNENVKEEFINNIAVLDEK